MRNISSNPMPTPPSSNMDAIIIKFLTGSSISRSFASSLSVLAACNAVIDFTSRLHASTTLGSLSSSLSVSGLGTYHPFFTCWMISFTNSTGLSGLDSNTVFSTRVINSYIESSLPGVLVIKYILASAMASVRRKAAISSCRCAEAITSSSLGDGARLSRTSLHKVRPFLQHSRDLNLQPNGLLIHLQSRYPGSIRTLTD
eukprot:scpid29996/ scgid13317/ 